MNSDEMWLLGLWSGTFGAAVSAVAAALVAIAVLHFSNKHQTALAKKAREAATRDLEHQIVVQREEASRERGSQAIAVFLAELDEKVTRLADSSLTIDELVAMRTTLSTAAARWSMETKNKAMHLELVHWPVLLFDLSRQALVTSGDVRLAYIQLTTVSSNLREVAIHWYSADSSEQDALVDVLKGVRQRYDPRRMPSNVHRATDGPDVGLGTNGRREPG